MDEEVDGHEQAVRDFWRDLDRLRRQQGLSYQRLAKLTSIPHSTLQYWMTRRSRLTSWVQVQTVIAALGGLGTRVVSSMEGRRQVWRSAIGRPDSGRERATWPEHPEAIAPDSPGPTAHGHHGVHWAEQ